jgi:hypothetical protein
MYDIVEGLHRALRVESTWAFVLVIAVGAAFVGGFFAWVIDTGYKNSKEYKEENPTAPNTKIGDCTIVTQHRMPNPDPSPPQASDQQLLRASLAIRISLLNLQTVDYNASLKAMHGKTADQSNERRCAILQEYETNLRIPSQIVQQTFLDRLPPEERVLSKTSEIASAYAHPNDIKALSIISNDLSRLAESLEKTKGIKENDDPKNDWIITPFPRFTSTEPRNESDYPWVQQYSAEGYVARLRSNDIFLAPSAAVSGNILVVLKRDSNWSQPTRVRVIFDNPLQTWMSSHKEGRVEVGDDFVEFTTDQWQETESVELTIKGSVRIKRLLVTRPS